MENIVLHNNIEAAFGKRFIPHDAIRSVLIWVENNGSYKEHHGKIEVCDNVFSRGNRVILGPVKISSNAVVAVWFCSEWGCAPRCVLCVWASWLAVMRNSNWMYLLGWYENG